MPSVVFPWSVVVDRDVVGPHHHPVQPFDVGELEVVAGEPDPPAVRRQLERRALPEREPAQRDVGGSGQHEALLTGQHHTTEGLGAMVIGRPAAAPAGDVIGDATCTCRCTVITTAGGPADRLLQFGQRTDQRLGWRRPSGGPREISAAPRVAPLRNLLRSMMPPCSMGRVSAAGLQEQLDHRDRGVRLPDGKLEGERAFRLPAHLGVLRGLPGIRVDLPDFRGVVSSWAYRTCPAIPGRCTCFIGHRTDAGTADPPAA